MNIVDYIPVGSVNAISRARLRQQTGLGDRMLREVIAQARRDTCICNNQDGSGYYMPESVTEAQRWLRQEENRLKSIGWSLKGTRTYIKSKVGG